jgi:hypothetical protein
MDDFCQTIWQAQDIFPGIALIYRGNCWKEQQA